MQISEVITALENLKAEHGDIRAVASGGQLLREFTVAIVKATDQTEIFGTEKVALIQGDD